MKFIDQSGLHSCYHLLYVGFINIKLIPGPNYRIQNRNDVDGFFFAEIGPFIYVSLSKIRSLLIANVVGIKRKRELLILRNVY